ncbi:MAG: DJ-1/PfpI family protein [Agathobacter rectalis]
MIKVGIFMADGCEEIEGLTVVDIVRRAKLEIETISITEKAEVTSSHQVTFKTDTTKAQADFDSYDAIVLPGGMPGTLNLGADETVVKTIKSLPLRKTCCSDMRLACSVRIIYLRAKKLPVIRVLRKSCSVHSGLSSL